MPTTTTPGPGGGPNINAHGATDIPAPATTPIVPVPGYAATTTTSYSRATGSASKPVVPKLSGKHGERQATFDGGTGVGKHRREGERLHGYLCNIPPVEFETITYDQSRADQHPVGIP